jgi:hypothetical protein
VLLREGREEEGAGRMSAVEGGERGGGSRKEGEG